MALLCEFFLRSSHMNLILQDLLGAIAQLPPQNGVIEEVSCTEMVQTGAAC
ncbi:MAG: hypothetical protein ACYDCG_11445 [Candidatus Acidiferrales bacterium]